MENRAHRVDRDSVDKVMAQGAALRRHLGALAAAIARTEEQMADTLERMARSRPKDARRLLARADQARQFAAHERDQAADYGHADSDPGGQ